jgi:hypothetical protein
LIPQRNLSRLANRLAKAGGRRIPESVLERDYCLSWFLAGLSENPLRNRLFFKGGTALKKCHFPDYRFSEDLDFTLGEEVPFEAIRQELDVAFEKVYQDSGVLLRYARSDRQPHANSHTFYLSYEGPLGNLPSGKEVKTDITIKEKVVFPIEELPVLRGLMRNTKTSPVTPSSRCTHLKKLPRRRLLLFATGHGTSPATFTTSVTYARTPTLIW